MKLLDENLHAPTSVLVSRKTCHHHECRVALMMMALRLNSRSSGESPLLLSCVELDEKSLMCGSLAITFCTVVRLAEQLTVTGRGGTALAPGGNMVGVHLVELPHLSFVGVMSHGAV